MPARRVQNRLDSIPATTRAAHAASEVVDEALRRQSQFPEDTAIWAGTGAMFIALGREMEQRGQRMLAADRTLDDAREESRRLQQWRDRLAKSLYQEVGELRRRVHAVLGRRSGVEYLRFLGGATSRDPVELARQARRCHEVLTADAPPASPVRGVLHQWGTIAESLRSSAKELARAARDVYSAHAAEILALRNQRQAIEDFDALYRRGTRFLEAQLDIAGLPSLADRIRPGVGRRGRPRKEKSVDAHPDLVRRALESDSDVDGKSQRGLRELAEGEEIIEQRLRELPIGLEKSEQGLDEQPETVEKSQQRPREFVENGISDDIVEIERQRRPRKRIVFGLANRMTRRPRPVVVEKKVGRGWPLEEVREVAAEWWKRLRRVA